MIIQRRIVGLDCKTNHANEGAIKRTMERTKEGCKRTNKRPKWTKCGDKFDVGLFWMLKPVWETLQDAVATGQGRPRSVPGAILSCPGRAKSVREKSKSVPGPVPGRSRTVLEQCRNQFGASRGVANDRGTIFCPLSVFAQKPLLPRNVPRTGYNVLLAWSKVGSERM